MGRGFFKVLANAISYIGWRPLLFVALAGSVVVVVKVTKTPSLDQIDPSKGPKVAPMGVEVLQPKGFLPVPSPGFLPTTNLPENQLNAGGKGPGKKQLALKGKKFPSKRRPLSDFWRRRGGSPQIRSPSRAAGSPASDELELAAAAPKQAPAAANFGAVTSSPSSGAAQPAVAPKGGSSSGPSKAKDTGEGSDVPADSETVEAKTEVATGEETEVAMHPVSAALELASPFLGFFDLSCAALTALEVVNVKCHGAAADGVQDDTNAIRRALEVAARKRVILFPNGIYIVSDTLAFGGQKIVGASVNAIIKVADSVTNPIEELVTANELPISLKNMTVDANHGAVKGVSLKYSNGTFSYIENVVVKNATGSGFHCHGSKFGSMSAVHSVDNGGDGFHFAGCTGFAAYQVSAAGNNGVGIRVLGAVGAKDPAGGVYVNGGKIHAKQKGAIVIGATTTRSVIKGLEIETLGDGIVVNGEARYVSIVDNRFKTLKTVAPAGQAIVIKEKSFGCYIAGNTIFKPAESVISFSQIAIDGVGNIVKGNYLRTSIATEPLTVKYHRRNMVIADDSNHARSAVLATKFNVIGFRKQAPDKKYKWRPGDAIFNGATSEPYGWYCAESLNSKCEWQPFNEFGKVKVVGGPGL